MKKLKIKIGVVIVLLSGLGFFLYSSLVDVVAVSSKPKTCENVDELMQYYGIKYDWSKDYNSVVFTTDRGEFKLAEVENYGLIKGSVTKDGNYYLINGSSTTVSKNKSLTIPIDSSRVGEELILRFVISESDDLCLSMDDFNDKKDDDGDGVVRTFETGKFSITVPNFGAINAQITTKNSNYDGICRAIREGVDPTGKIKNMSKFDGSAQARTEYMKIVGNCFKTEVVFDYSEKDLQKLITAALDAWDLTKIAAKQDQDGTSSWSINFNNVANAAKGKGHAYRIKGDQWTNMATNRVINKNQENAFSMSCKYAANSATDFSNLDMYKKDANGKKVYNIDANVDHFYAIEETANKVTYKWNYEEGSKAATTQQVEVCNRVCEEAVEVKYGPPIASKAGLCFEYQIQTTSRVKCSYNIKTQPPTEPAICNPIPICNNIPGISHWAGPNEEFEACVNKCDGGKYTKKCSNKCYKQVYGNTNIKKTASGVEDINATKLAFNRGISNAFPGYQGKYLWGVDNTSRRRGIIWYTDKSYWTYARYFGDFEDGLTRAQHASGEYRAIEGHKKQRQYTDTGFCKQACVFIGCSESQYLNKSTAQKDYVNNVNAYRAAIQECKASASCTTKSAVFKINVSYTNADNKKQTIEFPYSTKKDTLQSSDKKENCKNPSLEGAEADKHILLQYGGCYENCGVNNEYHARWSFPGTWINNKTGEISYEPGKSTASWTKSKDKFCIPLDAKNVNQKWWNYYYNRFVKDNTESSESKDFQDKCSANGSTTNSVTKKESISASDVEDWNLKGETTDFGYFGWNFKFKCFYALNSDPTLIKTTSTPKENKELCTSDTDYRIRSVDLENLFPSTSGAALSSSDTTGRRPGFNWSEYADNTKNIDFVSLPSAYTKVVQKLGYKVYNDNYLDYEFNINKNQLRKLKDHNRNTDINKYNSYTGETVTQNGVVSYKSNLFRNGGILDDSSSNKIPAASVIGCNNIDNHKSTGCASATN